jgi:prophage regulatory protein
MPSKAKPNAKSIIDSQELPFLQEAPPIIYCNNAFEWWTAKMICRALGIGKSTFFKWVKNGLFPKGIRLGSKSVRYPSSDILAIRDALAAGASEESIKELVALIIDQRKMGGTAQGNRLGYVTGY